MASILPRALQRARLPASHHPLPPSIPKAARCLSSTSHLRSSQLDIPPFRHPTESAPRHSSPSPQGFTPMPYVTETVGGGWHTYDIFSRLLRERIILLSGPIDETTSASIVAQLLFLEADNPRKPISLYINSPGGHVTAGLAIYDTMQYLSCPVSTTCIGQAASMGSLLLAGGEKGQRFALKHSSVMVHQPSGGYSGQATDIAIHAREILRVRGQLNEIYRRHLTGKHREREDAGSGGEGRGEGKAAAAEAEAEKDGKDGEQGKKGVTLEEVEKLMERDYFMGAEEALELGIVDRVLDRRDQVGEGGGKKEGE